jgi:hypothetical protein
MSPFRRTRDLPGVFAAVLAFALAACSVAGAPQGTQTEEFVASPIPSITPDGTPPPGDAWLVTGAAGEPGLRVLLASTREELVELPMGIPDDTWGEVISTRQQDGQTLVDVITVQPDLPRRTQSLAGSWRLPTLGNDALPVGVSADRSTIVLVEDHVADDDRSRFAVLVGREDPRIIELPGSFEFDALSPDGSILYVVEHLPGPPAAHYQVRALDIASGRLRDEIIVDKRNVDAAMGGWPITQLRHEDAVVFTLYRGTDHTFIHALQSREAWAVCLGLPTFGAGEEEAVGDWGLGQSADGRVVYALNATLGLAVAIDPGELSIKATARFDAPSAAASISFAKFGHAAVGPVGRRVVVTPDGSTIYAAGAGGITKLSADDLTLEVHVLEGAAVDALAMTPDGAFLFALLPDQGRIVKVDVASGQIVATVPGDRFDRLVAAVPW